MENVPMPESVLLRLASGEKALDALALLSQSVTRLNLSGCEIICIPCNTVHVFIDELRRISKAPIVSIIEESVKECKKRQFKKIGLLGSTTTIKNKLHAKELQKIGIKVVLPTNLQQKEINKIIFKIVTARTDINDIKKLQSIIHCLKINGADSILLACTDLRTIIFQKDIDLPVIDTTTALEDAIVQELL